MSSSAETPFHELSFIPLSESIECSSGNDCSSDDDSERNTPTDQQRESQRHTEETVRKLSSALNELVAHNVELEGANAYVQLGHAILTAIQEDPAINAFASKITKITDTLSSLNDSSTSTDIPVSQSTASVAPGSLSLQAGSSNDFNPAYRAFHDKPTPSFIDYAKPHPSYVRINNEHDLWYNPELKRDLDIQLLHQFNFVRKVDCVGLSKDGKVIAVGCTTTTYLYSIQSYERVARLTVDDNSHTAGSSRINSLCFSPDGKYLAIAKKMNIYIYDLKTLTIHRNFRCDDGEVVSLDYFPDGEKLLSGSKNGLVAVWTLKTSDCLMDYHEKSVKSVSVSWDGKHYVVGFGDNTAGVWDADSELQVQFSYATQYNRHRKQVLSVKFVDGNVLSSSADGTAKLWNFPRMPNKQIISFCEVTYKGRGGPVNSICLMPNIECVMSGSQDGKVICWNKTTGHPRLMLQAHLKPVTSLMAVTKPGSSRGILITSSNEDCNVRVWEVDVLPISAPIPESGVVNRCMTDELVKQASSNRTAHRSTGPRAVVKPAHPASSNRTAHRPTGPMAAKKQALPASSSRAVNISSRFKVAKKSAQQASSSSTTNTSTQINVTENLARFERIDWTVFPIQAEHVLPTGTRIDGQAGTKLKKLCTSRLSVKPRYHFEDMQDQTVKVTITLKDHQLSSARATLRSDAESLAAMAITEYPAAREIIFEE